MMSMDPTKRLVFQFSRKPPETYAQLREFIEKERPDWPDVLMPRRINAPSDYWPQKVLVFASLQAAIGNQLA